MRLFVRDFVAYKTKFSLNFHKTDIFYAALITIKAAI